MRVTVSYPCKWLQGWLLDMVNLFGACGGFRILHERIVHGENLTVPLIAALIKWGLTYLHLICVLSLYQDWPVSLYQIDPCLCTRLTPVSVPDWPLSLHQDWPLSLYQDWPLSLYQTDPCLCTRLTRVSVPDWPLSLYQTDPCLCARLTLVFVPDWPLSLYQKCSYVDFLC